MKHRIEIPNGVAFIEEYHNECVTIYSTSQSREVGGNLSGNEEAWFPVKLNTKKLIRWLKEIRDQGQWTPDNVRVQYQIGEITTLNSIEAPVLFSEYDSTDSIEILDGRHRITALDMLGAKEILVMVPQSQVQIFTATFL